MCALKWSVYKSLLEALNSEYSVHSKLQLSSTESDKPHQKFHVNFLKSFSVSQKLIQMHNSDRQTQVRYQLIVTGVGLMSGHLAVQFLHCDKVQRLQRMSRRGDEIKADVDTCVMVVKQRAFNLQLLLQVVFKLSVNVVDNRFVTVERHQED